MNIENLKLHYKNKGYIIITLEELAKNVKRLEYILHSFYVKTDSYNKVSFISFPQRRGGYYPLTSVTFNVIELDYKYKVFTLNGFVIGSVDDSVNKIMEQINKLCSNGKNKVIYLAYLKDLDKFF